MKPEKKRTIAAQLIDEVPAERREAFQAAVYMTIKSVKDTFPDLPDETLGKFCEAIARVVSGFNVVPVSDLNNIITSMFTAYMVASAQLEGVIEANATPEHVKEIVEEAIKSMLADDEYEDTDQPYPNTGQYL